MDGLQRMDSDDVMGDLRYNVMRLDDILRQTETLVEIIGVDWKAEHIYASDDLKGEPLVTLIRMIQNRVRILSQGLEAIQNEIGR